MAEKKRETTKRSKPIELKGDEELNKTILALRAKNYSYRDIAELVGVSKDTVRSRLNKYEGLKNLDTNMREFILEKIKTAMDAMTPEKAEKTSFAQLSLVVCQLFDKLRELDGKSANKNVLNVIISSATNILSTPNSSDELTKTLMEKLGGKEVMKV